MIEIPADIRDQMVEHAVASLPNEACGLLAGRNGRVERFYPMRNADQSRTTYRLDPKDQFQVFSEIEDKGWELAGISITFPHLVRILGGQPRAARGYFLPGGLNLAPPPCGASRSLELFVPVLSEPLAPEGPHGRERRPRPPRSQQQ